MNEMQIVKRHFFAMRNGIIADTLRRAGSPYHIIFGLIQYVKNEKCTLKDLEYGEKNENHRK